MEDFDFIEPMKAKLSDTSFLEQIESDGEWAVGEKFDGYREQLHLGKTRNELFSSLGTSHIDKVPQFKPVVRELIGTVLDAEGMAPTRERDDNAACFKAYPENAITWQRQYGNAYLVIFDVLYWTGEDITSWPFKDRLYMLHTFVVPALREVMPDFEVEALKFTNKLNYYEEIIARTKPEGHEGVIAKRMDASYRPGKRGPGWLKIKRREDYICTIIGFLPGCGKFAGMVGSLVFEGNEVSGTASGMDDAERALMTEHPEHYIGREIIIQAQEKTRYGALISPQYKGLV